MLRLKSLKKFLPLIFIRIFAQTNDIMTYE